MSKLIFEKYKEFNQILDQDIVRIVSEELPEWKAACDNPRAEAVMLHQDSFGKSIDEILSMALAIKYAELVKKHVTIVS